MRNPLVPLIYDRVMAGTEAAGLSRRRAELLADARGEVLEIGAGTGANLAHYPRSVTTLWLTDPDPAMVRRLQRAAEGAQRDLVVLRAGALALPVADDSMDEVVSTLVFCSVGDPTAAAEEIARVLRPGGRLRFIEHVAATPEGPSRLQRAIQPLHRLFVGGCRLDHSMVATLAATGFEVAEITDWRLPAAVPWVAPAVVGVATRG
jgi:ubiquinone/menaquinone biosynthesis C-methylase UbiE